MENKQKRSLIILFVLRVILWITAIVSTIYWIWFSVKLKMDGILAPEEYSPRLRPVLYTCLIISLAAVAISFALYSVSKKIKKYE
ncbi:MAG: hypothetical protein K6F75_12120 [Butyrivibrio sp.]|nr:hypothetical protein [Butyrivibrio sp.]